MGDGQHFKAANQGLVVREDGEFSSRCDGSDENIHGTALNAVVEAEVEETGGLNVIVRQHLLIEERGQRLAGPNELAPFADAEENFLADDANDGNAAASDSVLEFDQHPLSISLLLCKALHIAMCREGFYNELSV